MVKDVLMAHASSKQGGLSELSKQEVFDSLYPYGKVKDVEIGIDHNQPTIVRFETVNEVRAAMDGVSKARARDYKIRERAPDALNWPNNSVLDRLRNRPMES